MLRNPVDRLLSHYRNLLWVRDDPRGRIEEKPFVKYLEEKEMMWLGGSFADFLERTPRAHVLRQLYMFSESYDVEEAAERILGCSAVCFTETFGCDLQRLARRLDLPLKGSHERRSVVKVKPSATELALAREMLAPEFVLLERVRRCLSDSPT